MSSKSRVNTAKILEEKGKKAKELIADMIEETEEELFEEEEKKEEAQEEPKTNEKQRNNASKKKKGAGEKKQGKKQKESESEKKRDEKEVDDIPLLNIESKQETEPELNETDEQKEDEEKKGKSSSSIGVWAGVIIGVLLLIALIVLITISATKKKMFKPTSTEYAIEFEDEFEEFDYHLLTKDVEYVCISTVGNEIAKTINNYELPDVEEWDIYKADRDGFEYGLISASCKATVNNEETDVTSWLEANPNDGTYTLHYLKVGGNELVNDEVMYR